MRDYGDNIVKETLENFGLPVFSTMTIVDEDEDENQTYLDIHTDKGDITVIVNYDENGAYLVRVRTINGELKEGNFTLAHTVFAPLGCTRKIEDYRKDHTYVSPKFVAQCIHDLVEDINITEG